MNDWAALEIDAGNTALKWRSLDRGGEIVERGGFVYADAPLDPFKGFQAEQVRVACVAGEEIKQNISNWVRQGLEKEAQFAQTAKQQAGLRVAYEDPSRLGIDRWLAMLAALECQRSQNQVGSFVVVDSGSAITLDVVNADGLHLGGYIVPGLTMMEAALLQNTGEIHLLDPYQRDISALGKSTEEAVGIGVLRMATAFVNQVYEQVDGLQSIYLTGGDAEILRPGLLAEARVSHVPDLVFDGLSLALAQTGS